LSLLGAVPGGLGIGISHMYRLEQRLQLLLEKWKHLAQEARESADEHVHLPAIFGHGYGVSDGLEMAVANLQRLLDERAELSANPLHDED
jgi:hypothetical protein